MNPGIEAGPIARLEAAVTELRREFAARYGDDLSRLVVDEIGGQPRLRGTVVVPRQRQALERLARTWPEPMPSPVLDVVALTELDERDPRATGRRLERNGAGTVPLWSRRVGGQRVSEWLAADGPARLLHESEERWLVELVDATVGWCDRGAGTPVSVPPLGPPLVRCLGDGETVQTTESQRAALFAAARAAARAAIPYRFGGRDPARGLDCSAFVQGLLVAHVGAWLPRHTGDQLKVGGRVPRAAIAAGDLVFARAAEKNWLHVGVALDGAEGEARPVAHACRIEGRVRLEPLGDFLRRYRYLRAQRVLVPSETA